MEQVVGSYVEQLSGDSLERYWPTIAKELERVPHIWKPWWTIEYLHEAAFIGGLLVLAAGPKDKIEMVVFCQISRYPACYILQAIIAFGQHMDRHLEALAGSLEVLAIHHGCSRVEIGVGRKGWARKLRPWRPVYEVAQIGFDVHNTRMQ